MARRTDVLVFFREGAAKISGPDKVFRPTEHMVIAHLEPDAAERMANDMLAEVDRIRRNVPVEPRR